MMRWLLDRLNGWVLVGTLVVTGILVITAVALVYLLPRPAQSETSPTVLTLIPGPTPTYTLPAITPSPTPTQPVSVGGISVGMYVQITGTEGQGLRLRVGPGTSQALRFLGMDSEVFLVKDGPSDADGYTWWYLEAPYDPSRTGWAVSQYLTIVNSPEQPQP